MVFKVGMYFIQLQVQKLPQCKSNTVTKAPSVGKGAESQWPYICEQDQLSPRTFCFPLLIREHN